MDGAVAWQGVAKISRRSTIAGQVPAIRSSLTMWAMWTTTADLWIVDLRMPMPFVEVRKCGEDLN
jgi:hypothetical protein